MKEQSTTKNIIKYMLTSVAIYFSLFFDMSKVYPNVYLQSADSGEIVKIVSFLQRFDAGFGDYSLAEDFGLLMIVLGMVWISKRISDYKKGNRYVPVLSIVFSALYLLAESFMELNNAKYVIGDGFVFFISFIRFWGLYYVISTFLYAFLLLLNKVKTNEAFKNYKYITLLSVIVLAWLPHLIAIFPGGYCNDVQNQLMQFFGYIPMSDPHPPMFTFLVGACVWIGNLLHMPSMGMFLYVLIQYMFMACSFAYCVWFLQKRVKNKLFIILAELYFAFLPLFSHYASVIVKDAPYATCLLWMSISAYELLEDQEETLYKIKWWAVVRFAIFAVLASLLKHNGVYIAVPMFIFLLIYIFKQQIKKKEKALVALVLSAGIVLFFIVTKIIYPFIGIEKGMDHLIYTNMLQHTCRLALEYPGELTEADIEAISGVIDFEQIETYYNPVTSDGIKPIVDLEASDEAVKEYSKVWMKQVMKHPLVIWEASFNVSYGFLAPVARNEENDFSIWYYASEYEEFNFTIPNVCLKLRYVYELIQEWCVSLPVIRVLQNPGLYFWLFVFLLCLATNKKGYKYIIAFVPGIMTSIFYVGIPAYYHHPRYAFPLIFSSVFYIGLSILTLKQSGGQKVEDKG